MRGFTAACLVSAAAMLATEGRAGDPVVVELFTSQGCNACPPADALLAELAGRDDVIALALHVDYWNYLGWRDLFSDPSNTERQRQYREIVGARTVYTPQMVVDGREAMIGSRRAQVLEALSLAAAEPHEVKVELDWSGDEMVVRIDPLDEGAATPARILCFLYEPPQTVAIERGENSGRTLTYHNAVRFWTEIGAWTGEADEWRAPTAPGVRGVAVVVQAEDGRILGAAKREFDPPLTQARR